MTYEQIEYMESLARMDLRKKERSLEKAQRKHGQHPADFRRFQEQMRARIEFVKETLTMLRYQRNGGIEV